MDVYIVNRISPRWKKSDGQVASVFQYEVNTVEAVFSDEKEAEKFVEKITKEAKTEGKFDTFTVSPWHVK